MITSFFATTVDDWSDPAGQLHAYLVPAERARMAMLPAMAAIADVPYLGVQPESALHATIQRLPFMRSSMTAEDVAALENEAARVFAELAPITLRFASPIITHDSVLLLAEHTPEWDALTSAVRRAASVLGENASHYDPPYGPHISLAYAKDDGPKADIATALGETASEVLGDVTFDSVAWCAVHRNPGAGTYTFDIITETPLAETR